MQTLVLSPMPKKSMYAVKLWEVTPPKRRAKKPMRKRQSLIWLYLMTWRKER